uniref:SWIM-type domain-containing protein n=1 Tax=Lactuca sativa TaxID=4236 RepID=A0A9R1UEL7_LACSA|nr:hypothetical protein LSAT_V11C900457320 [Lactuca sativa]
MGGIFVFCIFYFFFKIYNVSRSKLIHFCFPKIQIHVFKGCFLYVVFIGSVPLRGDYLKTMLIEAPRQGRGVSFITNMNDVISSCIEHVFPDSYHGRTSKSVFKYMCTKGISSRTLQHLFWMTSSSYISVRWEATKIPPEIPSPLPSNIYRVFDFKKTYVVDLNRHTCSYGEWCSLGIACSHAIVASRRSNIHELYDMVQIYYQDGVFQTTYQTQNVHLLPPPNEWEILDP